MSASVLKKTPSFLLQTRLIWLAVLISYYFLYDFNATRFQSFLKNFLDIFFLFVPLETLPEYPDNDISHWLS